MSFPQTAAVSVEEYFLLEDRANERHEYVDGELFLMAGGTPNHNRIMLNLAGALNAAFGGVTCEAFAGDLRVQIKEHQQYAYPDVVVVCGQLELAKGRKDTITNPVLSAEILSDSTRDYDRGSKFSMYRAIPSLHEYLVIEQRYVSVEYFSKEPDNTWRLREYGERSATIAIESLQIALTLDDIYQRVELPQIQLIRA